MTQGQFEQAESIKLRIKDVEKFIEDINEKAVNVDDKKEMIKALQQVRIRLAKIFIDI